MSDKKWANFVEKYKKYVSLIQSEFDSENYLNLYEDVKLSGIDPFAHYVMHGAAEGRKPNSSFENINHHEKNFEFFITTIFEKHGINPKNCCVLDGDEKYFCGDQLMEYIYKEIKAEFDVEYYISQEPDLNKYYNPIIHYMMVGVNDGYNPAKYFDTKFYLNKYADIKNAGINPFYHYLCQGKKEGRMAS